MMKTFVSLTIQFYPLNIDPNVTVKFLRIKLVEVIQENIHDH